MPVPTRNGAPFGRAVRDGHPHDTGLLEWVDGEIMRNCIDLENPLSFFERLGALLARLHKQTTIWEAPAAFFCDRMDAGGLMGE